MSDRRMPKNRYRRMLIVKKKVVGGWLDGMVIQTIGEAKGAEAQTIFMHVQCVLSQISRYMNL